MRGEHQVGQIEADTPGYPRIPPAKQADTPSQMLRWLAFRVQPALVLRGLSYGAQQRQQQKIRA